MRPALTVLAFLMAVACTPARYRAEPPRGTPPPSAEGAEGAAGGAIVVGHVSPEGTLVADTLAHSLPDTARVERETVVTGEIRPAVGLATGWRVQVFASRARPEAEIEATRVERAIDDPAPVYVEWDDPWYKVRVGDFPDRGAAERLREHVAGLGWPGAWAVQTTIRTTP